jgi:hypothetical protein
MGVHVHTEGWLLDLVSCHFWVKPQSGQMSFFCFFVIYSVYLGKEDTFYDINPQVCTP